MTYELWTTIGHELETIKYNKRYITPEQYIANNPLENLVVPLGIENFFGTKVLNIFIIGVPYGWEKVGGTWVESWPPAGLEESVLRHKMMYKRFTKYETHIFMDFNIVEIVMSTNSTSKFREMMNATKTRITAICDDLANCGYTLEPDITQEVTASHFSPIINTFYN